ncbi:MAG: glycosyl hydrolase [Acidobacteriota bacterium]
MPQICRRSSFVIAMGSILLGTLIFASPNTAATEGEKAHAGDENILGALDWRELGPYRGGRSAAVAGVDGDRDTYYFGTTGGGVFKTTDAGRTWVNMSDGTFGGSIGAVAVAPSDPNVIYVGGGEKTVRGNVSHGDGVHRSVDGGASWTHVGLGDSRHISRIRIDPQDPDHAYVCAMGHLFGPNEERGVFRTRDGGETWDRIHFVNEQAGCVDLTLDPNNARVVYATFWRVLRTPYSLESGGDGSSMWKSTDRGESWTELSSNPGLPEGPLGIMGITVSPSDSQNLYAMVEAKDGGVFRSRDGGETWTRTNESRDLRQRAWYYTRIYADPGDAESVYVLNVRFHRSQDGGKTFQEISTPHSDNHDLWIDPRDPNRMVEANDGGANVSFDGGLTWSTQANQPTAQMYRVSVDNSFPYRVLGGQQDNSTVRVRSRSFAGRSIGVRDWEPTAGCECGHVVAKPDDPEIVFGGCYGGLLQRINHRTGESQLVDVWPDDPMGWGAGDLTYRFQWNFPIFFSPHDPNRIYTAAQVLFRSDDLGRTWQRLSDDLTRNDKSKQGSSGGPITQDNTSVEYYATIFAALESPHEKDVLWTGSDDGLIHLSRDGGETWNNVTPKALPEWTMINSIEAHPFEKGGLYVAGTRYKLDDFRPYLYKTTDYGATWTEISAGIAEDHFTRVIRADPDRRGLLYAGTERGVYASFDDGGAWHAIQGDLPISPVTDLAVKDQDLVVATQGRGFWVLDDLSLLHQLEDGAKVPDGQMPNGPWLFTPRPTHRLVAGGTSAASNAGENPPDGALFHLYVPAASLEAPASPEDENADGEEAAGEVSAPTVELAILDGDGEVIRTFTQKPADGGAPGDAEADALLELDGGLDRFVWDLRYPAPETFDGMVVWNRVRVGPKAVPGTYRARLTVGESVQEVSFEVLPDPRSSATPEDYRGQFEFLQDVGAKLGAVNNAVGHIRDARSQVKAILDRLGDTEAHAAVRTQAETLLENVEAIEKKLYQTQNRSRQDPLNFPIRLNDKLGNLIGHAAGGDFAPVKSLYAVRDELYAQVDAELEALDGLWATDLPTLNAAIREAEVPAIALDAEEPSAQSAD